MMNTLIENKNYLLQVYNYNIGMKYNIIEHLKCVLIHVEINRF